MHGSLTDPACQSGMQAAFDALPQVVRARLGRLRQRADKERSLLGYLLAARGLKKLGVERVHWSELRWSAFGRPSLPVDADFNISHAGDKVVCALSSQGTVGVDIEPLRPVDLDGMEQYMNAEQWAEISRSEDASAAFLRLWTLKESVVKCDGTGLSLPVREIRFGKGEATLNGRIWHVKPLSLTPDFTGALASSTPVSHLDVSHWQT